VAEQKWEPWVWYPQLWKTEADFWTYLRGSLRGAVWNKSPIKISFKNSVCGKPPEGYTGRAKSGAYCALTGEWEGKSKLQIDHKTGNVSLRSEEDILDFIKHLVPPPNSLQPVKADAHKVKSYAERQGISFEEALLQKTVIAICKGDDKAWLIDKGHVPESNAKKRRDQIRKIIKEEQV
jgi:hypothetical protein